MLRHQSLTQGLDWLRDPISSSSTALLELVIPGRLRGRGASYDWTEWAHVTKAVYTDFMLLGALAEESEVCYVSGSLVVQPLRRCVSLLSHATPPDAFTCFALDQFL